MTPQDEYDAIIKRLPAISNASINLYLDEAKLQYEVRSLREMKPCKQMLQALHLKKVILQIKKIEII